MSKLVIGWICAGMMSLDAPQTLCLDHWKQLPLSRICNQEREYMFCLGHVTCETLRYSMFGRQSSMIDMSII